MVWVNDYEYGNSGKHRADEGDALYSPSVNQDIGAPCV